MNRLFIFSFLAMLLSACNDSNSPKEITKKYFSHFNKYEWASLTELYADSVYMKDPALGNGIIVMRKEEIVKKYAELQKQIPDIHDEVVNMVNFEEGVVVEFISSGSTPNKEKFSLPICSILYIKDGKIYKDFTYYDNF